MATPKKTSQSAPGMRSSNTRTAPNSTVMGRQRVRDVWKQTLASTQADVTSGKMTKQEGLKALTTWQEQYNPKGQDTWLSQEMGYVAPWAEEIEKEAKTGKLKEEDKKATEEIISKFQAATEGITKKLDTAKTAAKEEITTGEAAAAGSLKEGYDAARTKLDTAVTEQQGTLADVTGEYDVAEEKATTALGAARDVLAPWKTAGEGALSKFQEAMGMGGGGTDLNQVLSNLPGFQFRMEQGLGAVTKMQAARGGVLGGRAMQELQQTGQGIASEEFGRYLGGLSDLMGRGQTASGAISGLYAQEASLSAGFGEMRAGARERVGGNLMNLRMTQAGMEEQAGANLANLRATSAQTRANIEVGVATTTAGIAAGTATGAAQMRAATQATGTGMEFQTQMTSWSQSFQKQMAEWEANTMSKLADKQANQQLFTTLLGGGMQVGAAVAGRK